MGTECSTEIKLAGKLDQYAQHLTYKIKTINLDLVGYEGKDNSSYLEQIDSLLGQLRSTNSNKAHTELLKLLEKQHAFIIQNAQNYYQEEQLREMFYDLELLLAQSNPELDHSHTNFLYTSSQHQFDLNKLITEINKNDGIFRNPQNQEMFQKRDIQLIKIAASEHKIGICSQKDEPSEDEKAFLGQLRQQEFPLTVKSRYQSESERKFNPGRIYHAVKHAFRDVYRNSSTSVAEQEAHIHRTCNSLLEKLTANATRSTLHVETIQTMVETTLMELGYHEIARSYVLYRDEKNRIRKQRLKQLNLQALNLKKEPSLRVNMPNGTEKTITQSMLLNLIATLAPEYTHMQLDAIVKETLKVSFNGIDYLKLKDALIMSSRCMIETHPDYSFVSARLLAKKHIDASYHYLAGEDLAIDVYPQHYQSLFAPFIHKGIENGILNKEMANFNLEKLAAALRCERDKKFTYLGLQTLYDRYFIHDHEVRYELPQIFFMRVAMGLALNEQDKNNKAIEFYNLLSSFDFMSSTPTLFNSGTVKSQLSSCYLSTIPDDLHAIYSSILDNAMLSKFAGGLGNDWTYVRGTGARIKGTNGASSGIVPFLNVADATAIAVNQGGKRKGAVCAYLETWHIDVVDFLELRKNTGDERRRTHDMNTANWIPDLFMQRVMEKGEWTLFSPDDVIELHDSYGKEFTKHYLRYEEQVKNGEIPGKTMSAEKLWRKMLSMVFETGHPWMTFKDPCNIRSPQQHCGTVHSSNLCTEITLNTSVDEIAVCNLGSINLAQHMQDGKLDEKKLAKNIKTAIRMLDNVIDINYYAVDQAKNSNFKHRPIGLGLMGFQDALYHMNIGYETEEAITFADESMELISYLALQASSDLAKERGSYQSYQGSLWDQGILPIDSIEMLKQERGEKYLAQDQNHKLDWDALRKRIQKQGMRNSNVLAIAPTATIANICGVTQSIEPTYQNLFVKSNLSGEFTVVNPDLVRELEQAHLWDDKMIQALKISNGSIQNIARIPEKIKSIYKTAFEIDIHKIIQAASRRAKWLDQSQSLNLYLAKASGKRLDAIYKDVWRSGLKTSYYMRTLGATDTEKSSINDHVLNTVSSGAPKACAIDDPECEACQ